MGYYLDKETIEAARKAYDEMTDEQKKRVPADKLKKLTDAEKALAMAEKKATDPTMTEKKTIDPTLTASVVADAINKLPAGDNVEEKDKTTIEAARRLYDALPQEQKMIISADILKKLTDAEKALAEIEKKPQKVAWVQKHQQDIKHQQDMQHQRNNLRHM